MKAEFPQRRADSCRGERNSECTPCREELCLTTDPTLGMCVSPKLRTKWDTLGWRRRIRKPWRLSYCRTESPFRSCWCKRTSDLEPDTSRIFVPLRELADLKDRSLAHMSMSTEQNRSPLESHHSPSRNKQKSRPRSSVASHLDSHTAVDSSEKPEQVHRRIHH